MMNTAPARLRASIRRLLVSVAVAVAILGIARADDDAEGRPWNYAPDRPIDVLHMRLQIEPDIAGRSITASNALRFRVGPAAIDRITLDAIDIDVSAVRDGRDGKPLRFDNDGKTVTIRWAKPLAAGDELSVLIDYAARPKMGLNFFAPSETEPDVPLQVWSQGEPEYNRHWIPSIDSPQERQTTETIILAEKGYETVGNGELVGKDEDPETGKVRWHWRENVPHTTYLITLVVGKFDVVRDEPWRGKPIVNYLPVGKGADSERSFGKTRAMLDFFSDRIGVPYPYEKYAHVVVEQFSSGGMENTSATTLNDYTVHDERAHLDFRSDGLVAHELAHQWYGDLITCRDWSHLWLNEGFATYFAALWKEHDEGKDEFALSMDGMRGGAMRSGKSRPMVDRRYTTPREMFDGRAYPKGAWILHMLRGLVGDELWWKSIQRYTRDAAGRSVEAIELRTAFERETGRNLEHFFRRWVHEPGHPVVELSVKWLEDERLLEVVVKQTQEGEAFDFPVVIGLLDEAGEVRRVRLPVDEARERLLVPAETRPVTVCVDDGHFVLKDVTKLAMPRDMLAAGLKSYPDPIWRIDCAKTLGKDGSDPAVDALAAGYADEKFWGVRAAIARALAECATDGAREALLAAIATEQHPKARRAVVDALGTFHGRADVATALVKLLDAGDPSYYVEAAAASALAKVGGEGTSKVLAGLLDRPSHNDVIRSAALGGLVDLGGPIALEKAVAWSRPGHPYRARRAAIRALGKIAVRADYADGDRESAARALAACLEEPTVRVRRDTIRTMRSIGEAGAVILPILDGLGRGDPDGQVRLAARDAAKSARAGEPAHEQLERLRRELAEATERTGKLVSRVEELEAKLGDDGPGDDGKGPADAPDGGSGGSSGGR